MQEQTKSMQILNYQDWINPIYIKRQASVSLSPLTDTHATLYHIFLLDYHHKYLPICSSQSHVMLGKTHAEVSHSTS